MPASPTPLTLPSFGRATRRTTIVAASALALTGCRWGPEDDLDADGEPSVEPADGDAKVAAQALSALRDQLSVLVLQTEEHVGLASALGPLIVAHSEHAELLSSGSGDEIPAATIPPESAARALARVHRQEKALQQELAGLALEATSGDLARALASISASIAQHLAVLPELGRGPA